MSAHLLDEGFTLHGDGIAASIVARLQHGGDPVPSMVTRAVAESFVARAAALRSDADREALLEWIAEICATYGDVAGLRALLETLPAELARSARELIGRPVRGAAVDELERDVLETVARAWRPLARPRDERLDEVDARIDALVVRLEHRDPLSSEHSRAVAGWCSRLARRLGLDAAEVTFATRCGLLHDVGKALTPLEILNAPRGLTDTEWKIMRAHAAAGDKLVRGVPELRPFAPAVRSHHERLDGRGYPDGLPAAAIPLTARIVAVADCFNAMIGRRPYRVPMAPSRALEELTRNRGTQFDPEIVDAMVEVVQG
ncbi:MAG TPA: HD domain-containing phosphohydrolase [Candidatus Elarobacter sp.]|nr:HD domain-containing phosphohydrolase [Candidatus Elarobacter sp.]